MRLPNPESAFVAQEKIVDYLLNPGHPDNGGKARFFISLGFDRENWTALATALKKLAHNTEISARLESTHGAKYIIDGHVQSATGRSSVIRTIWIVDRGENIPRLVTAYPHEE